MLRIGSQVEQILSNMSSCILEQNQPLVSENMVIFLLIIAAKFLMQIQSVYFFKSHELSDTKFFGMLILYKQTDGGTWILKIYCGNWTLSLVEFAYAAELVLLVMPFKLLKILSSFVSKEKKRKKNNIIFPSS